MSTTRERKIMEGIVTGDRQVIKEFYTNNYPYIRKYIIQNSGDETDAEDVFQDAIIMMYQKLKTGTLEVHSSLRTYFYAICKNIWRNRLRRNKKFVGSSDMVNAEEIDVSLLEEIEQKEREQLYQRYFLKLSHTCRELLTMVFEGKTMREISDMTEYSSGYARKKKFDCKKSLMDMIEKDSAYHELTMIKKDIF
ncbi:hypothetical protein GCM10022393_16150 [Aquimarina addita]|uniref:RNA polymerase sigma-70 region 2 domain-containing protein n=1 Tax=Aquimarina addita TaxID=870485 RepID=A0ABP7XHN0_9FLAO